ncbi:MAG: cobalamin-dependent protein [Spirochaetales bacterium]|nr:cobalamin-dependent protein [Spirochaetales bacterium]
MIAAKGHTDSGPAALLINPPVYDFALFDLFHKPYGLMRIARWLLEGGYSTYVLNCLDSTDGLSEVQTGGKPRRRRNGTGKFFRQPALLPSAMVRPGRCYFRYGIVRESIRTRLAAYRPDVILVTSGMTYWYPGVREIIGLCRELYPGVPVITGGIYASLMPGHCMNVCGPDFNLAGPAQPQLAEILKRIKLPAPASEAIPQMPLFVPEIWNGAGVLRLNEGCPCHCDYCASDIICPHYIPGKGSDLYAQFSGFYEKGIRHFAFYDDALLLNVETGLYPFLEQVPAHDEKVFFYLPNAVHARAIDAQCARLLYKAGFCEIRLGYESDNDDFHTSHGAQKTGRNVFLQAVQHLKQAGYQGSRIIAYTLAGLPGQKAEEAIQAARFAGSLGIRVSLSEYSPIPGTGLWDKALTGSRYDIEAEPVYHSNSYFSCEWEGFTAGQMERLRTEVYQANKKLLAADK